MGAHKPPTNRSLYLSVAASTLRFVIILALVVGGVVIINQAFPESPAGSVGLPSDGGSGGTTGTTGGTTTGTTGGTETGTTGTTGGSEVGPTEGTKIAVFNGAGVTGLAADVQDRLLTRYGYAEGQAPGNAPSTVAVTTIYYAKNADSVEAEFLASKDKFFKQLDVQVAKFDSSTEVDSSVQLIIYIGTDYASLVE